MHQGTGMKNKHALSISLYAHTQTQHTFYTENDTFYILLFFEPIIDLIV